MTDIGDVDGMVIEVSLSKSTAVITVGGVVDIITAPALIARIDAVLAEKPGALVIDLSDVDFLASPGLQALIHASDAAKKEITVAVVADGPATSRPIILTGVDDIIALYPTLDDALARVKG